MVCSSPLLLARSKQRVQNHVHDTSHQLPCCPYGLWLVFVLFCEVILQVRLVIASNSLGTLSSACCSSPRCASYKWTCSSTPNPPSWGYFVALRSGSHLFGGAGDFPSMRKRSTAGRCLASQTVVLFNVGLFSAGAGVVSMLHSLYGTSASAFSPSSTLAATPSTRPSSFFGTAPYVTGAALL